MRDLHSDPANAEAALQQQKSGKRWRSTLQVQQSQLPLQQLRSLITIVGAARRGGDQRDQRANLRVRP